MSTKIQLPSMLSFERKLEPSDGLMHAGNWSDIENDEAWNAISIVPRFNRSTQSAYGIKDFDKTAPNPVAAENDDANLPMDKDTLKMTFTLRVIGNLGEPFACNDPQFSSSLKQKVDDFKEENGIDELAFRYAYNIANGRFLWKNRVNAEKIKIIVSFADQNEEKNKQLEFNAYDFSLLDFDASKNDKNLHHLSEEIKRGMLSDADGYVFTTISAFVKIGNGQHVFPSQEMNIGEKKKKLFQLDGCAAIHNVKIGNAIRTIDTWYGDEMLVQEGKKNTQRIPIETINDKKIPIAIEPYGSVTQKGRAYRGSKIDLYTLMLDWTNNREIEVDQKKFVVACLIRGGVFGGDTRE